VGWNGNVRAVAWVGDALRIVDQTVLPERLDFRDLRDVDDLVAAVRRLAVRGAPALGAVGAYGVAVALLQGAREGWDDAAVAAAIARIRAARPTAVNLAAGVDRVAPFAAKGVQAVLAEADALLTEDQDGNRAMGAHGADWICARLAPPDSPGPRPLRVLTHCNTGALATTGWGTGLGVVRELHSRGLIEMVYVDETRPLLQGSRLTAWELARDGIPHRVQVDAAAASTICGGLVDVAIIGADRIAANGDVANKIGSLGIALACADAGIPVVVAAPWTTIDLTVRSGGDIQIEQRAQDEVLRWGGTAVTPGASGGFNPAFDVTPARLVTALVTEAGVLEVSGGQTPGRNRPVDRAAGLTPPPVDE
jgi:methylthioribose-1-phosphate isomerase